MPLRTTLSAAWQAFKEAWLSTTPPVTLSRLPAVSPEAMLPSDPLAMTATVDQELTGLTTQHRQVHAHLVTLGQSLEQTPISRR